MQLSNKILVVIDPTKSKQNALEHAVCLAKELNKDLELFICTHDDSLNHYKSILGDEVFKTSKTLTLGKLSEILETIAKPLRSGGLNVNCDVSWDWPLYEGIIRKAMQVKPFLIVKDTHYHSKLARTILRNTDWSLIKNCPYPILFDKKNEPADKPVILSCVNPINELEEAVDKDILELGELLTNCLDGQHKVFHSYKPISAAFTGLGEGTYGDSLDEQNSEIQKMHQNRLESLTEHYDVDRSNVIFEQGDAREILIEVAKSHHADIVIMGSQTKSGFLQAFVGTTAESVLDELECNVLVLKPEQFETNVSREAAPDYPPVVWPM